MFFFIRKGLQQNINMNSIFMHGTQVCIFLANMCSNNFVAKFLRTTFNLKILALGLKHESYEWIWDHSGESLDFSMWGNGQPDNNFIQQHVSIVSQKLCLNDICISIALLWKWTTIMAGDLLGKLNLHNINKIKNYIK